MRRSPTSQRSLRQTHLFVATFFLTLSAKFDFPLENCSEEERAAPHELLVVHADDMLTLAAAPAADAHDTPPPRPTAPAGLTWEEREVSKRRP